MKVLLINDSIGTGSVGKIVHSIFKGIISAGHECKIAYGRTNNTDLSLDSLIKIGNHLSILSDAFLSRLFGSSGTHSYFATKKALKEIIPFKPDLINVHSFYGYYINIGLIMKYAKKYQIPVVLTLHSCWDFTGHCCYFSMNNCNSWENGCQHCKYFRKTYPKSLLFDSTHKNYLIKQNLYSSNLYVVSPSNWISNLAKKSLLKNSSFYVIRNGINLNIFKKINCDKFKTPTILCVANVWDERKGFDDVLELADFLGSFAKIIVIGLSKNQLTLLHENMIGFERTSSVQELVEMYNKSTIFFNPTYEDNYPTVNLEAQACGLPVVTYDSGGSGETILNDDMGLIIKPKDYQSVKTFLEKKQDAKMPSNVDTNSISECQMATQYIELFERITKLK